MPGMHRDLLVQYAQLSADDWQDGFGGLMPRDKRESLSIFTHKLATDLETQADFKTRVTEAMDRYDDTLYMVIHPPSFSVKALARVRLYEPKPETTFGRIKLAAGYLTGKYPYVYAPDYYVGSSTDAAANSRALLALIAADFRASTGKTRGRIVADTFMNAEIHQAQLAAAGFMPKDRRADTDPSDLRGLQYWNTPQPLIEVIGPRYGIVQYTQSFSALTMAA